MNTLAAILIVTGMCLAGNPVSRCHNIQQQAQEVVDLRDSGVPARQIWQLMPEARKVIIQVYSGSTPESLYSACIQPHTL